MENIVENENWGSMPENLKVEGVEYTCLHAKRFGQIS